MAGKINKHKFWQESQKGLDHLKDLGAESTILVKFILKK
jgi:hypothetical protein